MLSNLPMITQLVSARAQTATLVCALNHCAVLWLGGLITALFEIICTFYIMNCYKDLNITDLHHVLGKKKKRVTAQTHQVGLFCTPIYDLPGSHPWLEKRTEQIKLITQFSHPFRYFCL